MGERKKCTIVSIEKYGPPDLYIRKEDDSIFSHTTISIVGTPKDHLEYYAWRREKVLCHIYFGCCILSKLKTLFRLVAKLKNIRGWCVTPYIIKRIWGKVQTEDGIIYTLGYEIPETEIVRKFI